MPATRLTTKRVEKPWGRRDLWPGFDDVKDGGDPVGEVWFEVPGRKDATADGPELLIKYLFTSDKLSVQVHPTDAAAKAKGLPRGKSEAWVVLDADPHASIAIGTLHVMTKDELRKSAEDGSIEQLLDWKAVKKDDSFYTPAGTIHAIGPGLTLIEVQQNSDTTYRLYDYGSGRELHLDDGVAVAHLDPYRPITSPGRVDGERTILVEGPKFVLERWTSGSHGVALPDGLTAWIVPITGQGEVAGVAFQAGECVTVKGSETIALADGADVLFAYPGTQRI